MLDDAICASTARSWRRWVLRPRRPGAGCSIPSSSALIPPPAPGPGSSEGAGRRPRPRLMKPSWPARWTLPSCSSGRTSRRPFAGSESRGRLHKGLRPREPRTGAPGHDLLQRAHLPPRRRGVGRFRSPPLGEQRRISRKAATVDRSRRRLRGGRPPPAGAFFRLPPSSDPGASGSRRP